MADFVIDPEKLFLGSKDRIAPRYHFIVGRKIKHKEFKSILSEDLDKLREEFYMSDHQDLLDWEELDKSLDVLVQEWKNEENILVKKILLVKYDLKVESFVNDEPEEITKLLNTLNNLKNELESR